MRPIARCVLAVLLVTFVSVAAFAQRGSGGGRSRGPSRPGTGDSTEHYVPWKYLEPEVEPDKQPLVVEWLPASAQEMEQSPLLDSQRLLDYSGQCIGLQVVLPDDKARLDKLGLAGARPVVLLLDGEGKILQRVGSDRGKVPVAAVEKMVQRELDARGDAILAQLNDANARRAKGETQAAVDIYRKVWDQRCLFPFAGHEAQRELRALGVVVGEPEAKAAAPAAPALKPEPPEHKRKPPREHD